MSDVRRVPAELAMITDSGPVLIYARGQIVVVETAAGVVLRLDAIDAERVGHGLLTVADAADVVHDLAE